MKRIRRVHRRGAVGPKCSVLGSLQLLLGRPQNPRTLDTQIISAFTFGSMACRFALLAIPMRVSYDLMSVSHFLAPIDNQRFHFVGMSDGTATGP